MKPGRRPVVNSEKGLVGVVRVYSAVPIRKKAHTVGSVGVERAGLTRDKTHQVGSVKINRAGLYTG